MTTTYCPTCGTQIIWLNTRAGRRIAVDANTVKPSHAYYLPKLHRAHVATCRKIQRERNRSRTPVH